MLSRQQIVSAYQLILGREPESEAIIEWLGQVEDLDALAMQLFASDEFRRRVATGALPPSAQKWVCAQIRHGLLLWVDLLDAGVGAGVLRDDWEPAETRFVLSQLDRGDCFVDIGANIGWFTVLAAHNVGEAGLVHAFEPRADLIGRLGDSVRANGFRDRCVLHHMALGAEDGEMTLASVPAERNPGHSFLMPSGVVNGAVPLGKVLVRRLDGVGLSRPVKLMKLDVEGAEAMVLAGARELLARDKPIIVAECFPHWLRKVSRIEPGAYFDILRDAGYRIFSLDADGPGNEVEAVLLATDREDRAFNLVALPSTKLHTAAVTEQPDSMVDAASHGDFDQIGAPLWRERLQELEAMAAGWQRQAHELSNTLEREKRQRQTERAIVERADLLQTQNAHLRQQSEALRQELSTGQNDLSASRQELSAARIELAIARETRSELDTLQERHAQLTAQYQEVLERARFEDDQARRMRQQILHLKDRLAAIEGSTIWKLTWPVRRLGSSVPAGLRANFGRAARVAWWSMTFQLPKKLRERTARQATIVPTPGNAAVLDRAESRVVPRVLLEAEQPVAMIIDDRWPEPDRDSGSLDAVNMITSLISLGYKVLFSVQTSLVQDDRYIDGIRSLGAHPIVSSKSYDLHSFIVDGADHISVFVLNRVGSGGQFLEAIRYNCKRAKIIFNTVDLHYVREARVARLSGNMEALAESERTRDREELLTARSDLTIVVSSVEKEILEASVPGANVLTLPLARAVHQPVNAFEKRSGIGFVGGFAHQPNIDAIRYFLSEVWPLVRKADPSIRFEIVGAGLPDDVLSEKGENVVYRGPIDDLDGWFEGLRLTVAPLRVGAGAKGKVASSLCAGLPCVASPIAAEGMGLVDGRQIFVGRDPADMATKILQLYADRDCWHAMSREALALAESSYSVAAFRRRLREGIIGLQLPAFAD